MRDDIPTAFELSFYLTQVGRATCTAKTIGWLRACPVETPSQPAWHFPNAHPRGTRDDGRRVRSPHRLEQSNGEPHQAQASDQSPRHGECAPVGQAPSPDGRGAGSAPGGGRAGLVTGWHSRPCPKNARQGKAAGSKGLISKSEPAPERYQKSQAHLCRWNRS